MPKKPERNESEYLKGIIRKQKAEIRHLRKALKKAGKDTVHYQELQEALEDEETFQVSEQSVDDCCPDCGKRSFKKEKLGVRVLLKCSSCSYSKFEKA